ncbi:hypothetical protein VS875_22210, partial [Salmonella enterica subsp. enterica serovar Paratyphi A]|nr:hypothetical protein [Salmonella enterica subsp. enterica serovar Paratyphi A]
MPRRQNVLQPSRNTVDNGFNHACKHAASPKVRLINANESCLDAKTCYSRRVTPSITASTTP